MIYDVFRDESYDVPYGMNDMQYESCGVSYVKCKYVYEIEGACGPSAVKQDLKKLLVVSLFNGPMLKTLGVELG